MSLVLSISNALCILYILLQSEQLTPDRIILPFTTNKVCLTYLYMYTCLHGLIQTIEELHRSRIAAVVINSIMGNSLD